MANINILEKVSKAIVEGKVVPGGCNYMQCPRDKKAIARTRRHFLLNLVRP